MTLSQAVDNKLMAEAEAILYLEKLKAAKPSPGQQAAINIITNLLIAHDDETTLLIAFNVNNVSLINPNYENFFNHYKKYFKFSKLSNFKF